MSSETTGLRRILARPGVYELWSRLLGGVRSRATLVREYVRPWPGARVLDLGCGPGDLIRQLWDVRYVGVDLNVPYIQRARRVYGDRAEFRVGDATRLDGDLRDFDLALAFGVLHHLDDGAATALCRAAARALVPGGRLVAVDPALIPAQHPVARFLITRDRGQYVRSPSDYGDIAQGVFTDAKVVVRNDLLRIPYTHCVIEATT